MPKSLYRAVVEVDVRDLQAVRHRFRQNGEVMVLARDLNLSRQQVLDRVVAAMVAELEPPRLRPAGQCQKLMPQANAHNWSDE